MLNPIEIIRRRATRIHLWLGEVFGLTHYRNCWDCVWSKAIDPPLFCEEMGKMAEKLNKGVCYCTVDGVDAAVDPSEAVWCDEYSSLVLNSIQENIQNQYELERILGDDDA